MNKAHHVAKLAWEALYVFSLAMIVAACVGFTLTERVPFLVALGGGILGIYVLSFAIYRRAILLEREDNQP